MFSQSTFFLEEGEQLSLVYQDNQIHGLGVYPVSSYNAEAAFEEACEDALQDLNSNLFLSVYIEMFKTADHTLYDFPELSIRDTALTYDHNVVKRDSFELNNQAYCIAGVSDQSVPIGTSMPDVEELMVRPVKVGDIWFSIGKAPATKYNPTISWMKAKNAAIKELTKALRTSVQSMQRRLEEGRFNQSEEMTYFKSNLIYNNIYNIRRYTTDSSFIVVVAVDQNDVFEY